MDRAQAEEKGGSVKLSTSPGNSLSDQGDRIYKDTRNCQEKVNKISHLKPNQLAPSIYIMKELCFFSLDR